MLSLFHNKLKGSTCEPVTIMGGGGGGYDRPPGGDSGRSDDGPDRVPPPEDESTEDPTDESNGTGDEETPEDSPANGGGDGSDAPAPDFDEGPNGSHEDEGSEADEEDTPENGDEEEEEQESPEGPEDDNGQSDEESDEQDQTGSDPEDEPDDVDSEQDDQDSDQRDHEEGQEEDQDYETDDEEPEDDDQEDDEENEEEDKCLIAESALLHSPNPEALKDAAEGDICSVRLREGAVCIVDSQDRTIGAIAEPWVDTLKECISQGRQYRALVLDIEGGKCEVRITNKCLLNRNINLSSINTAIRDQLHPELAPSVEEHTDEVVVVTDDGSRVGNVPNPWAQLLSECIDQGWSYKAEIRDVTPEHCTVNIQTASSDE